MPVEINKRRSNNRYHNHYPDADVDGDKKEIIGSMDNSTEADKIILELMDHLPDAMGKGEDWQWCWDELYDESQEQVKRVRQRAWDYLRGRGHGSEG